MAGRQLTIIETDGFIVVKFMAMGSPCEVLCETLDKEQAVSIATTVADEAWRVEDKYSRYLEGNVTADLNSTAGETSDVDEETANLIDFAQSLYTLSDGAFDVTSGVLRRVWSFDGSDHIPEDEAVAEVLALVGWDKVSWQRPCFRMNAGLEIDLGGLGKEYAVDNAVGLAAKLSAVPVLINFGGDLGVTGPPQKRDAWRVGIEGETGGNADKRISLRQGALATSGDARRFLMKDGVRFGHVLDPRTGWPVAGAASSITVAAASCTQAGTLSTLAMLKGPDAETFLQAQAEQYWLRW